MKQKREAIQVDTSANAWMGSQRKAKNESRMFMRKNYYFGFSRKPFGLGIMFSIDPPYMNVRRLWSFEIKAGWFIFWYVKEKRRS